MRLIDADKLMLSLNDNFLANSPTGNETLAARDYMESICEGLEIAMATVEGAPTVDAASVKHGKWFDAMVGELPVQVCDQCSTFFPFAYTGGGHHYCPNCGAKMDLEGHDGNE